jgi:hypothetical protein
VDDFRNKVIVKGSSVKFENIFHRVDRVLGFFSSRPNWDSPTPLPAGEFPPPSGQGKGHTRLQEWGWGPNSDEGTDNVIL